MSRKKDPKNFLLDTTVTRDDLHIITSRLPTMKEVIISFLCRKDVIPNVTQKTIHSAALETVIEEIIPIYERARIPTITPKNMALNIKKAHEEMCKIIKLPIKRRESGKAKEHIDKFKKELKMTMPFWPKNVFDLVKNEEDRLFLVSMQTDRIASMAGIDKNLAITEHKISQRKIAESKRINIEQSRQEAIASTSTQNISSSSESEDETSSAISQSPKRKHRRLKKTG